MMLHEKSIDG